MTADARWHVLTGEYPPQPGGVADYTALVAEALAAAGAEVHVWAPPAAGPTPEAPGVTVHREAGTWGRADLARLGAALDTHPGPRRLLVQHTPNAWGRKGLNLGLGPWLAHRRAAGDEIWLMVHEVAYPFRLRDRPWRWLLPPAHRRMIRAMMTVADRVFYSNPAFGAHLRRLDPRPERPMSWLPVPSTVPLVDDPAGVAAVRARVAPAGELVVGTFGTYGGEVITDVLEAVVRAVLADRGDRVGLLLGRGGDRYAAALAMRDPALRGRLVAPGGLPGGDISRHLHACDVVVLPYSDGVSTRRTTAMAALAHGRAVVTTSGFNTEPIWAGTGAVALAPAGDAAALASAAEALLADPARRAALGASAASAYARHFDVTRTVAALLGGDTAAVPVEPTAAGAYTGTVAATDLPPGRPRP